MIISGNAVQSSAARLVEYFICELARRKITVRLLLVRDAHILRERHSYVGREFDLSFQLVHTSYVITTRSTRRIVCLFQYIEEEEGI